MTFILAYFYLQIHTISVEAPLPDIVCVSCRDINLFSISELYIIKLVGSCSNCHRHDMYFWTVVREDGEKLDINMITTTTGNYKKNLVIRPLVLSKNYSYTFSLFVTSWLQKTRGFSNIKLTPTPLPPTGGNCTIFVLRWDNNHPNPSIFYDPDSKDFLSLLHEYLGSPIISLVDQLMVRCSGWIDNSGMNLPLEYHIFVSDVKDSNDFPDENNPHPVVWYPVYRGTRSNASFFLAPFNGFEGRVTLDVQVLDSLGSNTTVLQQ